MNIDPDRSPTRLFAEAVRRYRAARGWTQPQLADRCRESGLDWDRSIVANVESGRRGSVTLQEVLTLSYVFDVPPVLMIFPLGHLEEVEVLPGKVMDTWSAARWLTGEGPSPQPGTNGHSDQYSLGRVPVWLFRAHTQHATVAGLVESGGPDEDVPIVADPDVARAELRATRREIRRHGLRPPPLPVEP